MERDAMELQEVCRSVSKGMRPLYAQVHIISALYP
jgi:hypothetical protein